MKSIDLLSLTQGLTYILELNSGYQISDKLKLSDMKLFLKSTNDITFLDKLIKYEVPLLFTILPLENGSKFLYIVTFAGKIRKGIDSKPLNTLLPYSKILSEYCTMPYLASLLFNGAFYSSLNAELYDLCTAINEPTVDNTVKAIKECEDIFIVYGQLRTNREVVLKQVIDGLSGTIEQAVFWGNINSIDDYKKQLLMQDRSNYDKLIFMDNIITYILNFDFTYKSMLGILENIYSIAFPWTSDIFSSELLSVIEKIYLNAKASKPDISRLLRSIYALPRNKIVYEDNGRLKIEEALIRLKKFHDFALIEKETEELMKIMEAYDGSVEWFSAINVLRKELLIKITPVKNDFISNTEKKEIISLLEKIFEHLRAKSEKDLNKKNEILNSFIQEITIETLNKYINKIDLSYPLLYKGTAIIDTDMCLDENTVVETIIKANKIIMFGSCTNSLFQIFFKSALYQQKKDGVQRVAVFNTNYRQHTKLAEFISQSFYESKGAPEVINRNSSDINIPAFIWISASSKTITFLDHICEMSANGLSIGVLVSSNEQKNDLILKFNGLNLHNIHIWANFLNKEVDILYLILDKAVENINKLCNAMSKAIKTIVVVGDYNVLKDTPPLRDFYYLCVGDDIYGRFYN